MTYNEQLKKLQNQKRLHNLASEKKHLDKDSLWYSIEQAKSKIYNDYLDREIEKMTQLAIQEEINNQLNNIDFSVSINGDKLTDEISKAIFNGFNGKGR